MQALRKLTNGMLGNGTLLAAGLVTLGLATPADAAEIGETVQDQVLRGDLDGDQRLTEADARALENYLAGHGLDRRVSLETLDVDDSGRVDSDDLDVLRELVAAQARKTDSPQQPGGDDSGPGGDGSTTPKGDGGKKDDGDDPDDDTDGRGRPIRYVRGDVNGDGKVDVADLARLTAYLAGRARIEGILDAADVDGDGEITVRDASLLAGRLFPATGGGKGAGVKDGDDSDDSNDKQKTGGYQKKGGQKQEIRPDAQEVAQDDDGRTRPGAERNADQEDAKEEGTR